MASDKHQSNQKYIEEELAASQQDPAYNNGDGMPAEQYNSPESMKVSKKTTHRGRKSSTHVGYKF